MVVVGGTYFSFFLFKENVPLWTNSVTNSRSILFRVRKGVYNFFVHKHIYNETNDTTSPTDVSSRGFGSLSFIDDTTTLVLDWEPRLPHQYAVLLLCPCVLSVQPLVVFFPITLREVV